MTNCPPVGLLERAGSSTYARLRFGVGPGGQMLIPVEVDFSVPFPAADHEAWQAEYDNHVVQEPEIQLRHLMPQTGKKRVVPILGRLMELLILIRARDQASVGTVLLLSTNNLRREFHKLLKRAGLEPWEDCFQVLRRNCETDWSQQFPQHVVSTWVGHSITVSARHYLQVPEEVFERARTMR